MEVSTSGCAELGAILAFKIITSYYILPWCSMLFAIANAQQIHTTVLGGMLFL